MMISPESYYEFHLKGKSSNEILTAIRGLKRDISRLKKEIEGARFDDNIVVVCPSPTVQLSCAREYLERAIQAYEDSGRKYEFSKAEQKVKRFEDNIENICSIEFSIGGFFEGWTTYKIVMTGTDYLATKTDITEDVEIMLSDEWGDVPDEKLSKTELLSIISNLHIGEWLSSYDPSRFGVEILDGTQWNLEIRYDNGTRPFRFGGSNDYPWNFKNFLNVMRINEIDG